MNKGKAYSNRKKESERPKNDFYQTPICLTEELLNISTDLNGKLFPRIINDKILDPCCGKYAIGNVLRKHDFMNVIDSLTERDLMYGNDFLKDDYSNEHYDKIIMNPPFKLFDEFVTKAKEVADTVYCIGKLNYFGAHNRNINGLWEHLEWVLPFDRQVAYDAPFREDGKCEPGMIISGWFIWNKHYNGYPKIKVIDVNKYIVSSTRKYK